MPRYSETGFFGKVFAAINKLQDQIDANRIAQAPDYRLHRTSGGTKLEILGGGETVQESTPSEFGLFRVVRVFDDVLECYRETETSTTPGISSSYTYVLKPYEFRRSPFHNKTWGTSANGIRYQYQAAALQRRTAKQVSNGVVQSATETQQITPLYYSLTNGSVEAPELGSQIIATKCSDLNSDYLKSFFSDVSFASDLEWIDVTPGRVWAEVLYTP